MGEFYLCMYVCGRRNRDEYEWTNEQMDGFSDGQTVMSVYYLDSGLS